MVEDVALDPFVFHPGGHGRKAIDLDRNAVGRGLHHAHHHRHVLAHFRVLLQEGQAIGAEGADVGQPAAVGRHAGQFPHGLVGLGDVLRLGLQVVVQEAKAHQALGFFVGQETHAGRIDAQRALDAPAAGFEHVAVVAIAFREQLVGRHRGNGVVPVLHLDRMQRDVLHETIGVGLRHFDPVADAQHVVAGQLRAGHQRQQRVLEHQQQHRRQRAQARNHPQRRAVDQDGQHQHGAHRRQNQLADLDIALDGARLRPRGGGIGVLPGAQHAGERHEHADPGACMGEPADNAGGLFRVGHQADAHGHHGERHRVPKVLIRPAALQRLVPVAPPAQHQHAVRQQQHHARHHPLHEQRGQHQHAHPHQRLRPGLVRHVRIELGDQFFPFHGHISLTRSKFLKRLLETKAGLSDKSGVGAPSRPGNQGRAGRRVRRPAGRPYNSAHHGKHSLPRSKPVRQQGAGLVRPVLGTGIRTRQTLYGVRGFRQAPGAPRHPGLARACGHAGRPRHHRRARPGRHPARHDPDPV
ncbi:hypothetical protein D3C85_960480 [compost metagenome]